MFFHQPMGQAGASPISRPFVVGLIMLLLFLGTQMEWGPGGAKSSGRQSLSLQGSAPSAREVREGVKEQIILDLSLSNERLERENTRLKQHVLDLRRAARACGCDLNATEADAVAAYPELGQLLKGADEAAMAARRGHPDEGGRSALAPVPAAAVEGLHIPERHRHHIPAGQDPRRLHRRRYRRLLLGAQLAAGSAIPE